MPTYVLKNKTTGETREEFMSVSEMEAFTSSGEWEVDITAGRYPVLDPMRLGRVKLPDYWKENLKAMRDAHPGSTIDVDG